MEISIYCEMHLFESDSTVWLETNNLMLTVGKTCTFQQESITRSSYMYAAYSISVAEYKSCCINIVASAIGYVLYFVDTYLTQIQSMLPKNQPMWCFPKCTKIYPIDLKHLP